jgi:hypothetical protein
MSMVRGEVLLVLLLICASYETLAFSSSYLKLPRSVPSATAATKSQLQLRLAPARFQGNTLPDSRCAFLTKADGTQISTSLRAGGIEPAPKGFVARIKGAALKAGGVLLLAFIAYHVALGALKTIAFWICTAGLAGGAFYAWNLFKGRKPSGNDIDRF